MIEDIINRLFVRIELNIFYKPQVDGLRELQAFAVKVESPLFYIFISYFSCTVIECSYDILLSVYLFMRHTYTFMTNQNSADNLSSKVNIYIYILKDLARINN